MRLRARLAPWAMLGGLAAALGACGTSGGTECACADPAVVVDLPQDRATQVVEVSLSGKACNGATAECTRPVASGCAQYAFRAVSDGTCTVDVLFASAPADYQVEVAFAPISCCPGYYVQPTTASPIEVPDVTADGGVAG